MLQNIYKYIVHFGLNEIVAPAGTTFLSFHKQGDALVVYAREYPKDYYSDAVHRIDVTFTGQGMCNHHDRYIGTVIDNDITYHAFEVR